MARKFGIDYDPKYPWRPLYSWDKCPCCFENFQLDKCDRCGSGHDDYDAGRPDIPEQMSEEEYLHRCIQQLQEQYIAAVKPYVDRLAKLRSLQPVPIFAMIDLGTLKMLKEGETE